MFVDSLFEEFAEVRYVAMLVNDELSMRSRADLSEASSSESDRYEELLVNPTLLKLASQRGNIDCGGLAYLLIRYGNFFQFVALIPDGHVSIAVDLGADIRSVAEDLFQAVSVEFQT